MMILKEGKDVSRKLYRKDILMLNELETAMLRMGIKTSQKELIDKSIKFAAAKKEEFLNYLIEGKKDNTKEFIRRFLNRPRVDFGENFLEEIDTTL